MLGPIQLPVVQARYVRVRALYLTPDPDDPELVRWACEDCSEGGISRTSAELGAQISTHLRTCPG